LLTFNGFNPTKHPITKELYQKAKILDARAEKEQSNAILIEALVAYKDLLTNHGQNLNDSIFRSIGERCVERMRFIGKLKAAIDIHKKLIERFDDEPNYRNQLAVTYLLGNQ
jgi:aspartate beta-hydroxylase